MSRNRDGSEYSESQLDQANGVYGNNVAYNHGMRNHVHKISNNK